MYRELFTLGLLVSCAWCLTCRDDEFNLDEVRCCKKCSPGWGVSSDCRYDNDTLCQPCKPSTFSSKPSHTERCRQCTVCGSNAKLIAECNSSHDTICECDAGLYFNLTTRKCQECTVCDLGYGVVRQCSKNQDTRCSPCVNGTNYSDEASMLTQCLSCSVCKDGQVTLRNCTTAEDSLCFAMDLAPGKPTKGINADDESSSSGAELIPLYCAIMGLIVAALLGYAIYKQWKIRGKKRRAQYAEAEKGYVTGGAGLAAADALASKKYSDVASSRRQEVEAAIMGGDSDSWMKVAKQLGCPKERISSIEGQCSQNNKLTPINIYLSEWMNKDGATVGILIKALRHAGRHDVIRVLHSEHRNSPQAV